MNWERTERYAFMFVVVIAAIVFTILWFKIRHQAVAIQQQRFNIIYRNCVDQNHRHDKAHNYLNKLLKSSGVRPARQRQSQQQVGGFIDAIIPKRNCIDAARAGTKGSGAKRQGKDRPATTVQNTVPEN